MPLAGRSWLWLAGVVPALLPLSGARAAEKEQTSQHSVPPQHARLIGRIVHSEVLPEITPDQSVGKLFSGPEILLAGLKRDLRPKKLTVPYWLAGTWSRTRSTEVSRIKLPLGERARPAGPSTAIVVDTFGTYKDDHGTIWQVFDPAKSLGQVDRGSAIDYHCVFGYDIEAIGPRAAIVQVQARHLVVDKQSHKIQSVYQDEELNTFTLVADGQVRTDSSVKVFDLHGKPLYLTRSVSSEVRTAPFRERLSRQALPADKK